MNDDCKHDKVVRREDGTWHCDYCEEKFYHLDFGPPGKLQFMPMPEVATLRDQFAMAALESYLRCYPGAMEGKRERKMEVCGLAYSMAEIMLEARK